ncbi:MAG: IS21 family transposase [Chloroflexota bacterium]
MDIRELLRHVRQGRSDRTVARACGVDRKTVRRYRDWAREHRLLEGDLPPAGELERLLGATLNAPPPPQSVSSVEPYREIVERLHGQGVEMAAIHARLRERGYPGSYASVVRFVRRLNPPRPDVVLRIETPPGEEAQVDFGSAGKLLDEDGRSRKAWAFVMTLSWSRHQYVEFVFDQKVETWLRCHRNAWEFFGGVPKRVVLDNLKAGIAKRCWDEPQAQQAYRECAEHYGFLIDPHGPGKPEHKGKVEQGGVHYLKRNFLAERELSSQTEANRQVLRWVQETAGQRVHGTTREQPLERFELERAALQPLPRTPYDLAIWKRVTLHRDGHVVFDKAYYSAPFRLRGERLWVRGGVQQVRLFTQDYQLVATHPRARHPGQRLTELAHLPPEKLLIGFTREQCLERAGRTGPATLELAERLVNHRPEDRLRNALRLVRLADHWGARRLELACPRALRFEEASYSAVKRILAHNLEAEILPEPEPYPAASIFVRSPAELLGSLMGGEPWN